MADENPQGDALSKFFADIESMSAKQEGPLQPTEPNMAFLLHQAKRGELDQTGFRLLIRAGFRPEQFSNAGMMDNGFGEVPVFKLKPNVNVGRK